MHFDFLKIYLLKQIFNFTLNKIYFSNIVFSIHTFNILVIELRGESLFSTHKCICMEIFRKKNKKRWGITKDFCSSYIQKLISFTSFSTSDTAFFALILSSSFWISLLHGFTYACLTLSTTREWWKLDPESKILI